MWHCRSAMLFWGGEKGHCRVSNVDTFRIRIAPHSRLWYYFFWEKIMKNYYSVKFFDVCFHHLIIFSANFQKDIREWGAILIRNVSTLHTAPIGPIYWSAFISNSINTAPIGPILKSHYELAFSATILECFYSPKSNQSHRFEKIFTTSTWLADFIRPLIIQYVRTKCKFIPRKKDDGNRTSRTSLYIMRKVPVSHAYLLIDGIKWV